MELRPKKIQFQSLKPKNKALIVGNRGRPAGTENKKTLKRKKSIANLSCIGYSLKKSKITQGKNKTSKDQCSIQSQNVHILLKKEVSKLDWEKKRILVVHAYYFFKNVGNVNPINQAAALYDVSETFVRKWKTVFKNEGKIAPYTKWGHNSKYISLLDYEDKVLEAKKWIRCNSAPKGNFALTAETFADYCNRVLMVDIIMNEKMQNKIISAETARRWLHLLGFRYSSQKGTYNDGHEKAEVREYRSTYLKTILEFQERSYLFTEEGQHVDKWEDITLRNKYQFGGCIKEGGK